LIFLKPSNSASPVQWEYLSVDSFCAYEYKMDDKHYTAKQNCSPALSVAGNFLMDKEKSLPIDEYLSVYGRDGWELVNVPYSVPGMQSEEVTFIFRRPLQ
jgi:hypothetical protein